MVYRSDSLEGGEKPHNAFRNDGSFLEMFKKLQEKAAAPAEDSSSDKGGESSSDCKSPKEEPSSPSSSKVAPSAPLKSAPIFGKRRGGRVLPTGKVKKIKSDQVAKDASSSGDAWSLYLAEVKRYKETTCEEDGKTRPLVK